LQLVRGWRVDGQKSVHECWLLPQEAQVLYAKLCALIDPQTDHVLLAWVNQRETPVGLGVGRVDRLFCPLLRVS
jgi:CRISPR-associated protein Cas2